MNGIMDNYTVLDFYLATGPAAPLLVLACIAYAVVAVAQLRRAAKNSSCGPLILLTFLPLAIGIWGSTTSLEVLLLATKTHGDHAPWALNATEVLLPLKFGSLLAIVFLLATLLIYAINVRQQARHADAKSEA